MHTCLRPSVSIADFLMSSAFFFSSFSFIFLIFSLSCHLSYNPLCLVGVAPALCTPPQFLTCSMRPYYCYTAEISFLYLFNAFASSTRNLCSKCSRRSLHPLPLSCTSLPEVENARLRTLAIVFQSFATDERRLATSLARARS